jgi:DDE superfamily endonuclease
MKMYQISEERRKSKIGGLWLYTIIQMAPIRFCVVCLEKVKSQHAVLVKVSQFLIVVNAKLGWTRLPTINGLILYFDLRYKSTLGVQFLCCLTMLQGISMACKNMSLKVEFFPQSCTSWKQPCDQGIINALKTRYKFLYLRAALCFYDYPKDEKEILQTLGTHHRRRSAGIEYGNPVHLMDAAKNI